MRMLSCIDKLQIVSSVRRANNEADCTRVSKDVDALMKGLELERHEKKCVCGEGSTCVKHMWAV